MDVKMRVRFENRNSPRRVHVHEIGLEDPFDRRISVLSHVWSPRSGPKRTQNRPFRIPRDPSFWIIFRRSIFLGGVPDGTRVRILSTCLRPETKTRAKSRSGKNEKISLFWSLKIAETIIYVAFERFSVERKTGPKSIIFHSE